MLPDLVVHADWSTHPRKRWYSYACRTGDPSVVHSTQLVGEASTFRHRLRSTAGEQALIVAGFDFPIGLPTAYARECRIERFLDVLPRLGVQEWAAFYHVCGQASEISNYR